MYKLLYKLTENVSTVHATYIISEVGPCSPRPSMAATDGQLLL